jgi:ornithine cyclodeaminase
MNLRVIDAMELNSILGINGALGALEGAFAANELPEAPHRMHLATGDGDLLLMPAADERAVGVKLVTVGPPNRERGLPLIQGVYVLFSTSLEPVAVIDGAALTQLRTAAVSGLATNYLARQDARSLVMFGAGVQAQAHLEAMCLVRPVEEVRVVEKDPKRATRLVEKARGMGLDASVADAGEVAEADLICTCTTSSEPVFDGALLREGAHVNAVGAFKPHTRELDSETVRRGRLVVEAREAALAEAGDLLIPIQKGEIGPSDIVADLAELVKGRTARTGPRDITVFKCVGMAFEDLVVATAAFGRGNDRSDSARKEGSLA